VYANQGANGQENPYLGKSIARKDIGEGKYSETGPIQPVQPSDESPGREDQNEYKNVGE